MYVIVMTLFQISPNTREIRDIFHFCAIHFLLERKSAMVIVYVIARIRVEFRINFASVKLSGNKIAWRSRVLFATHPNTSEICPGNFTTNRAIKD